MEFNREMRYLRQKLFDIGKKPLVPFEIQGKKYLVYGNVNLSVFLTDECNAGCNFCVARLRYFHEGMDFVKPTIADDNEYFARLKKVLAAVQPLNPSVSITGGEPSISHRLPTVLTILDSFNVRKRTMTTNGSGLLRPADSGNKTVLDKLICYRLAHLNISRAHYDEKINQEIMQIRGGFSNKELEFIVRKVRKFNIRPRLSCILLKQYVKDFDQILRYLDWAESIGVDNVVFRQIMGFNIKSIKTDSNCYQIPQYCLENQVELNPIWEIIELDPRFVFVNQVLGYYYYVEVYRYRGIDVVFESADLKLMDPEKEKSAARLGAPVIYELVFHPNGNLCGSWREWKEVLM